MKFEVGEIVYCMVETNVITAKMLMWDSYKPIGGTKQAYLKTLNGGHFLCDQDRVFKITDFTRALYE